MTADGTKYFILILSLLITVPAWTQEKVETAVILGQITDKGTGEPVENVNVYLANTTKGGWSASDGKFVIKEVPIGKCELVVSRVGYTRIVARLSIVRAETLSLAYELSEAMVEIGEVDVTEGRDEEWEENLDRFRHAFMGSSRYADDCVLLNPAVLDLTYDNDTLIARSERPLRIENKALGYRVSIVLDKFIWNTEYDYGIYKIYPFFEELTPSNRDEASTWEENRSAVWKGSLKHFLQTLYHGNSEAELFTLHTGTLKKLMAGQGHRVLSSEFRSDSISGTDYREFHITDPLRIEYGYQESGAEPPLRRPGKKTQEPTELAELSNVNILSVKDTVIVIDPRGNLFDPLKVEVAGGWGRSRVAELLPSH
jgi:hypothetical protein